MAQNELKDQKGRAEHSLLVFPCGPTNPAAPSPCAPAEHTSQAGAGPAWTRSPGETGSRVREASQSAGGSAVRDGAEGTLGLLGLADGGAGLWSRDAEGVPRPQRQRHLSRAPVGLALLLTTGGSPKAFRRTLFSRAAIGLEKGKPGTFPEAVFIATTRFVLGVSLSGVGWRC